MSKHSFSIIIVTENMVFELRSQVFVCLLYHLVQNMPGTGTAPVPQNHNLTDKSAKLMRVFHNY